MSTLYQIIYLLILVVLAVIVVLLFVGRKNRDRNEMEQLHRELQSLKTDHYDEARANREEISRSIGEVNRSLHSQINELSQAQLHQVAALVRDHGEAAERLRLTLDEKLSQMYETNEGKLEEMRRTVDEKLEATLDRRIGESFGQVNQRLEQVHKSLGEITGLSAELTDIKKLFSNVKSRGVWGEVQLSQILEDHLAPDQYEANVSTGLNSNERVEFAVKLPGRDKNGSVVYLPIDAKFPVEDYRRILDAVDGGNTEAAAECRKALERTLKNEAKMICDKYIAPPKTLDYGIMFLPTESLYSEALHLSAFMAYAEEHRVMVAGPTNLAALLNSLRMGFKTLAIEEKSDEIRKLLVTVKRDMGKFSEALDKAQKKIAEADRVIADANHRTELLTRRLKNVETSGDSDAIATEKEE